MKIAISFDETKPHWLKERGGLEAAASIGIIGASITGDPDAKLAVLHGEFEGTLGELRMRVSETSLREGSVHEAAYFSADELEVGRRTYEPEKAREVGEAVALVVFGPSTAAYEYVDCDICRECKDHAGFVRTEDGDVVSECCGAPPYDFD